MASREAILTALPLAFALACGSGESVQPTNAPAGEPPAAAPSQQDGSPEDAHQGMDHAGMGHGEEGEHAKGGAAQAPVDLASTWAALQSVRDAIAADIANGTLNEIHERSEGLEPSAKAVLERSSDLTPEQRARVESAVKQIPAVADKLHEAADGGDAARTGEALKQLDAVMELMRAQYPAGALEHEQHGSAAHDHNAVRHFTGHEHATRPLAWVDAEAQDTIVVKSTEFAFEPTTLEMRAGVATRIELDNRAALVEHSLLVRAPGGGDLIHLHAGPKSMDVGTYRLDTPGTFDVLCTIPGHTEAGMFGKLVVRAVGATEA